MRGWRNIFQIWTDPPRRRLIYRDAGHVMYICWRSVKSATGRFSPAVRRRSGLFLFAKSLRCQSIHRSGCASRLLNQSSQLACALLLTLRQSRHADYLIAERYAMHRETHTRPNRGGYCHEYLLLIKGKKSTKATKMPDSIRIRPLLGTHIVLTGNHHPYLQLETYYLTG